MTTTSNTTASQIDWTAVRARCRHAAEVLGIEPAALAPVLEISDDALADESVDTFIAFCNRHAISLDWLLMGNPRSLIGAYATLSAVGDKLAGYALWRDSEPARIG